MLEQEIRELELRTEQIVASVASDLFSELIAITPVDKGELKSAWQIEQTGIFSWKLSNNMEYAIIIFEGRRFVAGKWQGSEQLPDGIDPVLIKYSNILQQRLDEL